MTEHGVMFCQWFEVSWLFFYGDSCIWWRSYTKLFQVNFQMHWNSFHLNYLILNLYCLSNMQDFDLTTSLFFFLSYFSKVSFSQSKEWNWLLRSSITHCAWRLLDNLVLFQNIPGFYFLSIVLLCCGVFFFF